MISVRTLGRRKQLAVIMALAMVFTGVGSAILRPIQAQTGGTGGPVGQGFVVDAADVRFIYQQILVAQGHAAGGRLLGSGPNQVGDPQLPRGLRTVDGSYNNLVPVPDQHLFGAADRLFPRLTTPVFRDAQLFDPDGPTGPALPQPTSYKQKSGVVVDDEPRLITNLIVDQSAANPAAAAAAANPCGSGGFVCSGSTAPDPDSGALFIPNITPDFGLSAPFNLMFTFFGQFFDHGLDLVPKAGGTVIMPLRADDPLIAGPDGVLGTPDDLPANQRFMVMTRGQNQPGPDGRLGTADDIQEAMNLTTPWVDQNQTYTSHPSHQVFLREYYMVGGRPLPSGKVLDGGHCAVRPVSVPLSTNLSADEICNIANWRETKQQASTMLGIQLTDVDVLDVPLILTDPYGHFKPGPRGFPQLVRPGNILVEGDPTANGGLGISIPADAFRTGHAFLNDIAHNAVPVGGNGAPLAPDADTTTCDFRSTACSQPAGTYDDEMLNEHFVTGDGRGNENIALTAVHNIFHSEHNRLTHYIENVINTQLSAAEQTAWHAVDGPSGWGYGERLFQAARFVTEMQYQHLVFEEFARTMQPLINPFLGGITAIDGAISAEFAHTVYRVGHSMLPERVPRINTDGSLNDMRLLNAFLNPLAYNNGGTAGTLNAAQAIGSVARGLSREVGNELDEFVTSSVRNTLVGLPLDLGATNIARGRSEGIPPLNVVRAQLFGASSDAAIRPYANWNEFGLALRHHDSLINFVAAYGTDPTIRDSGPDGVLNTADDVTTVGAKRAAATLIVNGGGALMTAPASTSGLNNVDYWVGGLAEKPSVFGGLLGTTFNYVFEMQLEHLQDGDRFYYLQRTDGLNMRFSLEGNSLAELTRRNSDLGGTMDIIFRTADFNFDTSSFTGTTSLVGTDLGGGITLKQLADGTVMFFDPLHTGKNITFSGASGPDRFAGDVGDDSFFGFGGNDRFDGGEGNDTLNGGDGNDVLLGGNGDDVLKGGPGNDAMNVGPGFGGDLAMGGEGSDFMVGGDDGVEYFGGPGNDVIVDGAMRSEGIFGGDGDDWIFDGDGHDGGIFGDGGNVFDLLAGLDQVGGDDVEGGGPGQDNHFGEGGDDIFLMSEGSNKFFGDYGFDWVTQRGWPAPGNINLELLAVPGVILNFNDTRNFYRFTDGASGWDLNDTIYGDNNTADPAAPIELFLQPQMALTVPAAAKITGLPALMARFGIPTPAPIACTAPNTAGCVDFFEVAGGGSTFVGGKQRLWIGGNLLLGGRGSDTISGQGGNDLVDGDSWLNVQLEATLVNGTKVRVDNPKDLIPYVFSDPQQLDPGNIAIVREVITPGITPGVAAVPADCGAASPLNCDTVIFDGPQAAFTITKNANGSLTVLHVAGAGKFGKVIGPNGVPRAANDGTDTLLNVERLQFDDTTVDPATLGVTTGPTGPAVAAQVTTTSSAATNTLASPTLSAPPNTLLVALIAADDTVARPTTVTGVTNTAPRGTTTLTWTRAAVAGTQAGDAEIWWASTGAAGVSNTSVRARMSRTNPGSITVLTVTGASQTLAGAIGSLGDVAGTPHVGLTTSNASSLIVAVGTDQGTPGAMTAAAGQSIITQFSPTGGDTYWSQQTTVLGSGVPVTISATPTGTGGAWNLAAVEIRRQ